MRWKLAVWLCLVLVLGSKALSLLTRECSVALNTTIWRTFMLVQTLSWTLLLRKTLEMLSRMIPWRSSRPGSQAVQFKLWISCDYAIETPSTKAPHCV
jgi:hypothetical protein